MTVHYVNLTQGLVWFHDLVGPRFVRIESTRLEAKDWGGVLERLGADFLVSLATGPVCVYDASSRKKESRALWQGIPWIRYACRQAWELGPVPEYARGGHRVDDFFDLCWRGLSPSTKRMLRYYRRFEPQEITISTRCRILQREESPDFTQVLGEIGR